MRRQGYAGTGMKQVVATAGAPLGSVYHFFPGGKEQLAAASVERAGRFYEELVLAVFDAEDDVLAGTAAVFAGAGAVLEQSGYADACPIATIALEVASTSEPLREATDGVFASWLTTLDVAVRRRRARRRPARALAIAVISLLEGAFLLCRAARTTEAMDANGAAARALVTSALATAPRS